MQAMDLQNVKCLSVQRITYDMINGVMYTIHIYIRVYCIQTHRMYISYMGKGILSLIVYLSLK